MSRPESSRRRDGRSVGIESDAAELPLRDRKKARQRADLLRIALELFREEGFDKTRMEDIAARALVSTPTVYNYFANKREVLIEILMEDRRSTRESFERVVNEPPAEPADAFAALIYANISNIRRPEEKRLWRELLAAVARSHDRERDPFDENHETFKSYIKRLLVHYVTNGRLSEKLPVDLAADLIFAVNSHDLRHLAASRFCSPERIREMARDQISLLMTNWHSEPARLGATTSKAGPRKSGLAWRRAR
jgi:AcrR family transcriptional regulator